MRQTFAEGLRRGEPTTSKAAAMSSEQNHRRESNHDRTDAADGGDIVGLSGSGQRPLSRFGGCWRTTAHMCNGGWLGAGSRVPFRGGDDI
jgi:hypothetical protein